MKRSVRNWLLLALSGIVSFANSAVGQVPQLIGYQGRVVVENVNFDGTGQFKFALVDGGTIAIPPARTATATAVVNSGFITSFTLTDGGAGYTSAPTVTINDSAGNGASAVATVSNGSVTAIGVSNPGQGYSGGTTVTIAAPPPPVSTATYVSYWSNDGSSNAGAEPERSVSLPVTKGLYSVLLGDTSIAGMTAVPASVFTHPDVRLRVWFNDGVHGFQQLSPDRRIAAVGYAMMAGDVPDGAITSTKIAPKAVGTDQLAPDAVQAGNIAPGTISATHLAAGAVEATNIASGAISSNHLAVGAVGATQLQKPPRSGQVASSTLSKDFFTHGSFSVSFESAFTTTPVVTLSMETTSDLLTSRTSLAVQTRTPNGFSARWFSTAVPVRVVPETDGIDRPHMAIINGAPAFSFSQSALRYSRALDNAGLTWGPPVTVNSTRPEALSLTEVNGNPAIGYMHFNSASSSYRYSFVRSTDVAGSNWGEPVVVSTAPFNASSSSFVTLAMANGRPAMCFGYYEAGSPAGYRLKYIRASDANGSAWEAPITVVSIPSGTGTLQNAAFAIVDGNPAICYTTDFVAGYVRAADANGTVWNTPVTVHAAASGRPTLAVVNGNPAISFTSNGVKYVRAHDTVGSSWPVPTTVTDGGESALSVVNGNPALVFRAGYALKYVRSLDSVGSEWGTSVVLDELGAGGILASLNGLPVVGYYYAGLYFVTPAKMPSFNINWIALEP